MVTHPKDHNKVREIAVVIPMVVVAILPWLFALWLGVINIEVLILAATGSVAMFAVLIAIFQLVRARIKPLPGSDEHTNEDQWIAAYLDELITGYESWQERYIPLGGFLDNIVETSEDKRRKLSEFVLAERKHAPGGAVRIILHGPYACGKTIALNRICWECAQACNTSLAKGEWEFADAKIPILISLYDANKTVLDAVQEEVIDQEIQDFDRYANEGKFVFLFDIFKAGDVPSNPEENRKKETLRPLTNAREIADLARNYPGNGYIFVIEDSDFEEIKKDTILAKEIATFAGWKFALLTYEEIKEFLFQRFPDDGEDLYKQIDDAGLVDECVQPFVLDTIAEKYKEARNNPQEKQQLLQRLRTHQIVSSAVDRLFAKEASEATRMHRDFDRAHLENVLTEFASILLEKSADPPGFKSVANLLKKLPGPPLVDAYNAGFLSSQGSDRTKVGFSNPVIEKYFKARVVEQRTLDEENIQEYVTDPKRWWESVALAVAQSARPGAILDAILKSNRSESVLLALLCAITSAVEGEQRKAIADKLRNWFENVREPEEFADFKDAIGVFEAQLLEHHQFQEAFTNFIFPLLIGDSTREQTASFISYLEKSNGLANALDDPFNRDPRIRMGIALALYRYKRRKKTDRLPNLGENKPWHLVAQNGSDFRTVIYPLSAMLAGKGDPAQQEDIIRILEWFGVHSGTETSSRDGLLGALRSTTVDVQIRQSALSGLVRMTNELRDPEFDATILSQIVELYPNEKDRSLRDAMADKVIGNLATLTDAERIFRPPYSKSEEGALEKIRAREVKG